MHPVRLVALAALALATALPQVEAGHPKRHRSPARPTAQYDAAVPTAWGKLLYAAIRDEKINPPLASRLIGYFGVSLYEAVVPGMPRNWPLGGQLNGLGWTPAWGRRHAHGLNYPLAANAALPRLLRGLLPTASAATTGSINTLETSLAASLRADDGVSAAAAERSETYGRAVADAILAWAGTDGISTLVAKPYTPPVGPGLWIPTPPALAAPLLPWWGDMRPFAMLDASEFAPLPPPAFSTDPTSELYAAAKNVYDTVNANTAATLAIANFWADAGPGTGTPPGHWVSILTQIAETEGLGLDVMAEAFAKLGISQADAFICCWDTKYTHNLLRPVTYIQQNIDASWLPPLATPPFPTYTSGHSTQSGAASVVLEDVLGDVAFTDHTHDALGLPARTFATFAEAAAEAAVSRLYGGIHYTFDNEVGLEVGQRIGRNVLRSIAWRRGHCACR